MIDYLSWLSVIIIIIVIILVSVMCHFINRSLNQNRELFIQTIKIKPIPYTFYWINLDSATQRYTNMTTLFKHHHIKHHRIDAIRGGPDQYDKELACTKSHMKAIQTFYDSNEKIGIICEDDLTMEYQQYWRENLIDVVKNAPEDWEILQLALIVCYCVVDDIMCTTCQFANIKHFTSRYIPYQSWFSSALCYVVNRKAAKKILSNNYNPTNNSENFLFGQTNTYTYKYPMFTYPTDNDSSLHPKHLYGHVLSKNNITDYLQHV